MDATTGEQPARHEIRRRPRQARSRQLFEGIVEATAALIAVRGIEPITMTDIADSAGVAVSAVYRYFPSRQAIVRELALRSFDADAQFAMAATDDAAGTTETDVARHVAAYCRLHVDDRVRLQIRVAVHADSELSELDLEGSRTNAALIADALDRSATAVRRVVLERRALVLIETVDNVIRLASRSGADEADAIIEDFAQSAAHALLRPER